MGKLEKDLVKKIVDSIIDDFYSKKRNCGIVVKGGTKSQRYEVAFALISKVDVFVYTPNQCPLESCYFFDIEDYVK